MESGQCLIAALTWLGIPSQPWRLSGKLDGKSGILDKKPRLDLILSGKLDTVRLADSGHYSS